MRVKVVVVIFIAAIILGFMSAFKTHIVSFIPIFAVTTTTVHAVTAVPTLPPPPRNFSGLLLPKSCHYQQMQLLSDKRCFVKVNGRYTSDTSLCPVKIADNYKFVLDVSDYNDFESNVFHYTADTFMPIISFAETKCAQELGKSNWAVLLYLEKQWTGHFQGFFTDLLEKNGINFIRDKAFTAVAVLDKSFPHVSLYGGVAPSLDEFAFILKWKKRVWASLPDLPEIAQNRTEPVALLSQRHTRVFAIHGKPDGLFEVVDFGKMSVVDQLRKIYSADILVGAHGAGLTHGLWLRPGSVVIQVFPWYLCNWIPGLEFSMVAACGGAFHATYCIERNNVVSSSNPPDNFINTDINLQPFLYHIQKMTLIQKDFEYLKTISNQIWTTNRIAKSVR